MNRTDGRRSARPTISCVPRELVGQAPSLATLLTTSKHHLKDDHVLSRVAERLR